MTTEKDLFMISGYYDDYHIHCLKHLDMNTLLKIYQEPILTTISFKKIFVMCLPSPGHIDNKRMTEILEIIFPNFVWCILYYYVIYKAYV